MNQPNLPTPTLLGAPARARTRAGFAVATAIAALVVAPVASAAPVVPADAAFSLVAAAPPTPAHPPAWGQGTVIGGDLRPGTSTVYEAYVSAGGSLDVRVDFAGWIRGERSIQLIVTSPAGEVTTSPVKVRPGSGLLLVDREQIDLTGLTSAAAGVWTIETELLDSSGQPMTSSTTGGAVLHGVNIIPRDADGTPLAGRVWTREFQQDGRRAADGVRNNGKEPATPAAWNQTLYALASSGLMWEHTLRGFNGFWSSLVANNLGVHAPGAQNCSQQLGSTSAPQPGEDRYATVYQLGPVDHSKAPCDGGYDEYRLFFTPPDETMPASARSAATGASDWVFPKWRNDLGIEIVGFRRAASEGAPMAGEIVVRLSGASATIRLGVDVDLDGGYEGPRDVNLERTFTVGEQAIRFDGLDGLGAPVVGPIRLRADVAATGEFHVVMWDVEQRTGGVTMRALNGPAAGDTRINWNDSKVNHCVDPSDPAKQAACLGTTPALTGQRIDSTGGAHAWGDGISQAGTWGDRKYIDEWTYTTVDASDETLVAFPAITVTKERCAEAEAGAGLICPAEGELFRATGTSGPTVPILFTITNTGLEPLISLALEDVTTPGDPAAVLTGCQWPASQVLAAGESLTCTGLVDMGIEALIHRNEATATGVGQISGERVSDSDELEFSVTTRSPSLSVVKTSAIGDDQIIYRDADEEIEPITVLFTVTNDGDEALESLTWEDMTHTGPEVAWEGCDGDRSITAEDDGALGAISGSLEPGESITCHGTLTWGDTSGEEHRDTVTVTGMGRDSGTPTSDEDDWQVSLKPSVEVERLYTGGEVPESPSAPPLPTTGASLAPAVALAACLVAAGGGLVAAGTLRRAKGRRS